MTLGGAQRHRRLRALDLRQGGRLERSYHGPPRRRRAAPRVARPRPRGVPEALRPRRASAAGRRVERAGARGFVSSGVGVPKVNDNIPLQASLG